MLVRLSAVLALAGMGRAAAQTTPGVLKRVSLGDVRRVDAAGGEGWLARDGVGRLWQVFEDGNRQPLGEGLAPEGYGRSSPRTTRLCCPTLSRWPSPASVDPADADLYAVHTPHIGGVLHRYRAADSGLSAERVATGLTNHRIGNQDLDITARLGRWLLVPAQDWQRMTIVDLETASIASIVDMNAPILQLVTSPSRRSVAVLTRSGLSVYAPR